MQLYLILAVSLYVVTSDRLAYASVTGMYYEMDYYQGGGFNDWHNVTITNPSCDGEVFEWKNTAGVVWTLYANFDSTGRIISFNVGQDCPYYDNGHTEADILFHESDGTVDKIFGPYGEPYTLV